MAWLLIVVGCVVACVAGALAVCYQVGGLGVIALLGAWAAGFTLGSEQAGRQWAAWYLEALQKRREKETARQLNEIDRRYRGQIGRELEPPVP